MNWTTEEGERVYFDSNGDPPARYELVNIQMTNKGTMEGVTIGMYDASLPEIHQFIMKNIPVVWGKGLTEVSQRLRFLNCSLKNVLKTLVWSFVFYIFDVYLTTYCMVFI